MSKKSKRRKKPCVACGGTGWMIINGEEIQRCDTCRKYENDLRACIAYFENWDGKYYFGKILLVPKDSSLPGLPT